MRIKVKKLATIFEKSRGVIGQKNIQPVYFETRWGIHTFGVTQAIDVVILDSENRVVSLKPNLPANRFYFWNPVYKKVIELPEKSIKKMKISKGVYIELEG